MRGFICDRFAECEPATFCDISEFLFIHSNISIADDTLCHIVHRLPGLKVIRGIPMETERVETDQQQIQAYFRMLEQILNTDDIPAGMVVNLDESGHCEWVDAHEEKVVVPVDFPDAQFPMPVKRQSARSTLLGAIAASGASLKPLVIVHRETIETELYECGYTPDQATFATQENAFITGELFNQWTQEVLFPYFEATRAALGYNGRGILLLDGCTSHSGEWFLDEATWRGVEPIFFPPHSSDQVQPMDLGIFALEKTEATRCRPHRNLNSQSIQDKDGGRIPESYDAI
jgi:hypothetical protein